MTKIWKKKSQKQKKKIKIMDFAFDEKMKMKKCVSQVKIIALAGMIQLK